MLSLGKTTPEDVYLHQRTECSKEAVLRDHACPWILESSVFIRAVNFVKPVQQCTGMFRRGLRTTGSCGKSDVWEAGGMPKTITNNTLVGDRL